MSIIGYRWQHSSPSLLHGLLLDLGSLPWPLPYSVAIPPYGCSSAGILPVLIVAVITRQPTDPHSWAPVDSECICTFYIGIKLPATCRMSYKTKLHYKFTKSCIKVKKKKKSIKQQNSNAVKVPLGLGKELKTGLHKRAQ